MKGITKIVRPGCFGVSDVARILRFPRRNGGLGSLTACPQLRLCRHFRQPRCQGPGRGVGRPGDPENHVGRGPRACKIAQTLRAVLRAKRATRANSFTWRVWRVRVCDSISWGHHEHLWLIRFSRTSMAFGDAVPSPLGFVALRQKHGIGEGDEPHRQRRPGPWTVALPQRGLSPEGGLLPSRAGPATRDPPEQTPGGRTEGKWCRFRWNTDRLCFAHHVSGAKREIPGVRGQRPRRPVVALSPSTQKPDEPLLWLRRAPSGVRRRFSASSQ